MLIISESIISNFNLKHAVLLSDTFLRTRAVTMYPKCMYPKRPSLIHTLVLLHINSLSFLGNILK